MPAHTRCTFGTMHKAFMSTQSSSTFIRVVTMGGYKEKGSMQVKHWSL